MRHRWTVFCLVLLLVVACGPHEETKLPTQVATPVPTDTPLPTPTATPAPTVTPAPTAVAMARIVFVREECPPANDSPNIFAVNADGTGLFKVTEYTTFVDLGGIELSPDGDRILFSTKEDGNDRELFVINTDGSGKRRLTDNAVHDIHARWSPDGRHIAFVSGSDDLTQIYVMRSDGTGLRRLTRGDEYEEFGPTWSPGGDKIAFGAYEPGQIEGHIRVVNLDGSGEMRLTTGEEGIRSRAQWSPDGRWILYEFRTDSFAFNLVSPDGTRLVEPRIEGFSNRDPWWSPDGSKIGFVLFDQQSGTKALAVMDVDTLAWWKVTDGVYQEGWGWLPDSRQIYYFYSPFADRGLWIINDDGSDAHQVLKIGGGGEFSWCIPISR